ncbi:hypothetical protein [Pseudomonas syringae]|uniref:hypothetical protein n=1 Tax=Pseudomonas syringae TaxID=317 RepID=UPI000CDBA395|nr:hypothetical protein [Pseudomonas syringae]POR63451.1 hypothetical protein BKM10_18830 [Pseudomonas syringae pv. syringae]
MNYRPLILSIVFLAAVWGIYFWHFNNGFSGSQGDWGTFGDFTGGVVNPLLNFITIYILITQFKTVKGDLDKQRFDETVKTFESSFFTFTTIALSEYKSFELKIGKDTYKGAEAVGYIEGYFEHHCKAGEDIRLKFNELDQLCHDVIYSLASSFCVVFKLIEETCPSEVKDKYIGLFSMLLPTKITYLLSMAEVSTKWKLLSYPRDLGYFKKKSVSKACSYYREISGLG